MKEGIIIDINAENLREALEEIGWSLRHRGCGHYQVYNDYNSPTQFWFYQSKNGQNGEITLGENKEAFGQDGKDYGKNGHARFPVEALTMRVNHWKECYPSVSILFRGFTKGKHQTYITFYGVKMNEEKDKKREAEKK